MKEQLEYFIRLNLKNPCDEEIQSILEIFDLKVFQKNDYFKRSDQRGKKVGFIVEGTCRHYVVKANGKEITGRISQKNEFVADLVAIRTKELTPLAIKAVEPTKILVASVKDMELLLEKNLTFNRLLREYMADGLVEMAKMRMLFLGGTAKERYKYILENNPNLISSVPLRFIASLIGITPTQLSRIRNNK